MFKILLLDIMQKVESALIRRCKFNLPPYVETNRETNRRILRCIGKLHNKEKR